MYLPCSSSQSQSVKIRGVEIYPLDGSLPWYWDMHSGDLSSSINVVKA